MDNGNLLPPYGKGREPPGKGRPLGSRNRSTIVRELLEAVDKKSGLPNVDAMTVAVIKRALKGDTHAWEKLLDSGFGKIADEQHIRMTNPIEVKRVLIDDVYHQGEDADVKAPLSQEKIPDKSSRPEARGKAAPDSDSKKDPS